MNLSLRGQSWSAIIFRGLTILMAVITMIVWNSEASKVLLMIVAVLCFISVVFDIWIGWQLHKGTNEEMDERDRILMGKASERAITYSQLVFAVLALAFSIFWFGRSEMKGAYVMFIHLAINLPFVFKHALFLYLEATDEGDAYE